MATTLAASSYLVNLVATLNQYVSTLGLSFPVWYMEAPGPANVLVGQASEYARLFMLPRDVLPLRQIDGGLRGEERRVVFQAQFMASGGAVGAYRVLQMRDELWENLKEGTVIPLKDLRPGGSGQVVGDVIVAGPWEDILTMPDPDVPDTWLHSTQAVLRVLMGWS